MNREATRAYVAGDHARLARAMLPPKPVTHPEVAGRFPNRARAWFAMADMTFRLYGVVDHPNSPVLALHGPIGYSDADGRAIMPERVERYVREHRGATSYRVLLETCGGDLDATARIIAALAPIRDRLTVRAIGPCHSAGIDVLLQASRREAVRTASFVLHEAEQPPAGRWTAAQHRRAANSLERSDVAAVRMYAQRTGAPVLRIARLVRTEAKLSAFEARSLGLIHQVVD